MILKGMQPGGSGFDTTEPVGGSQGSLVPVAAPLRPASKGENKQARAVDRSAAPGYQNIENASPSSTAPPPPVPPFALRSPATPPNSSSSSLPLAPPPCRCLSASAPATAGRRRTALASDKFPLSTMMTPSKKGSGQPVPLHTVYKLFRVATTA